MVGIGLVRAKVGQRCSKIDCNGLGRVRGSRVLSDYGQGWSEMVGGCRIGSDMGQG